MAELSLFIGVLGTVITVLMFLSPVTDLRKSLKATVNNGFGAVAETAYVIRSDQEETIAIGILNVGVLGVAIISCQIWLKGEARTDTGGIMGAALNILLYGSPLAAMATNSL